MLEPFWMNEERWNSAVENTQYTAIYKEEVKFY